MKSSIFFQGPQGMRGPPGQPGPQGPIVSSANIFSMRSPLLFELQIIFIFELVREHPLHPLL